ncbi:hypothetical protein [Paludibacterium purpuratum]|uniref:Uncharacterized protein n=1 Tax=Paludibacterium purpuratum TaxID=1144873 RepID=A0A4R7BG85_9NEIS|nr:hypothetical protein [Paludibacterium purpuratum]TDR82726.1 hypothetical protein DFP86_101115 [Paludibacterium purpuratum]
MKKLIFSFLWVVIVQIANAECTKPILVSGSLSKDSQTDTVSISSKQDCQNHPGTVYSTIAVSLNENSKKHSFLSKEFSYPNNYEIDASIKNGSIFIYESSGEGYRPVSLSSVYQFKFTKNKIRLIGFTETTFSTISKATKEEATPDEKDENLIDRSKVVNYNLLTGEYKITKKGYDFSRPEKTKITTGNGGSFEVYLENVDFFAHKDIFSSHIPSALLSDNK